MPTSITASVSLFNSPGVKVSDHGSGDAVGIRHWRGALKWMSQSTCLGLEVWNREIVTMTYRTWKTRFHLRNVREKDTYGSGRVCVLDSIYLGARTDLYVFSLGNVNSPTYRDDILDAYVHPYAGAICDAFVLKDYNVKPHRDRIIEA
ncbi:transposable element Tcb2 transposase [Trichonephila clavipes]|nr:transposable element Tcb2 transposase [Trichonephila clavipes]